MPTDSAITLRLHTGGHWREANVMQRNNKAILGLAVVMLGGLFVLVTWPGSVPVNVRVTSRQPAEILDDAGAEMTLVTLGISRSGYHESSVYFEPHSIRVSVNVGGRWLELSDSPSVGAVGPSETKEVDVLMPSAATLCRIHLLYAGASIPWRAGAELARLGIKLPPRYWAWAGWPRAEGAHPRWRGAEIEVPLRVASASGSR